MSFLYIAENPFALNYSAYQNQDDISSNSLSLLVTLQYKQIVISNIDG